MIFVQSMVPEHAELHLLLSMITPLGWLERVPTYKEQIQQLENKDLSTYGFLGYPVLQTADIIIYRAHFVPVGEDQASAPRDQPRDRAPLQLPLRRGLPRAAGAVHRRRRRCRGIDGRKMSKSYGNAINLTDPPDVIRQKCKPMFTDPQRLTRKRPGPPGGLQPLRVPQAGLAARASGARRPPVPRRRDRLRRRQEAAGADPHRLPGADPPPPRGAAARPRHGLRHPRRGLAQGARAHRRDAWTLVRSAMGLDYRKVLEDRDGGRMSDETHAERADLDGWPMSASPPRPR